MRCFPIWTQQLPLPGTCSHSCVLCRLVAASFIQSLKLLTRESRLPPRPLPSCVIGHWVPPCFLSVPLLPHRVVSCCLGLAVPLLPPVASRVMIPSKCRWCSCFKSVPKLFAVAGGADDALAPACPSGSAPDSLRHASGSSLAGLPPVPCGCRAASHCCASAFVAPAVLCPEGPLHPSAPQLQASCQFYLFRLSLGATCTNPPWPFLSSLLPSLVRSLFRFHETQCVFLS